MRRQSSCLLTRSRLCGHGKQEQKPSIFVLFKIDSPHFACLFQCLVKQNLVRDNADLFGDVFIVLPNAIYILRHFSFRLPLNQTKAMGENEQPVVVKVQPSASLKEKLFAKKLYHSLQTANLKEWLALYPTEAECLQLLKKTVAVKLNGLTPEKPKR